MLVRARLRRARKILGSINEHNFIFQEFWAVLMNPVDFQKLGFWKKLMIQSDWPGSDLKGGVIIHNPTVTACQQSV